MQPSLASSSAWLDSVHLSVTGVSAAERLWCQCRRPSLASLQLNVAGVSAGARRWRHYSQTSLVSVQAHVAGVAGGPLSLQGWDQDARCWLLR